jgi:citrate lyase beta subunit
LRIASGAVLTAVGDDQQVNWPHGGFTVVSARRSLLFVPGDSPRKIEKSLTLDVDSVIFDLEDGVAANRKVEAWATVANALTSIDFGHRERIVRVNSQTSGLVAAEIAATVNARPDAYLAPKVESADDLRLIDALLSQAEAAHGWESSGIRLLAMIETALGVMNLREISAATPRLDALVFGAEDFAASTGAVRSREGWEIFYARSAIVTAAGAYGLQAIDCVHVEYQDVTGLEAECRLARQMGYVGKTLIHPAQVPMANTVFAPTPEEIDWAQRLTSAFEEHQSSGTGAFAWEGKMVDMPILRSAQRLLARSAAIPAG